jgi:hypothetical protein
MAPKPTTTTVSLSTGTGKSTGTGTGTGTGKSTGKSKSTGKGQAVKDETPVLCIACRQPLPMKKQRKTKFVDGTPGSDNKQYHRECKNIALMLLRRQALEIIHAYRQKMKDSQQGKQ